MIPGITAGRQKPSGGVDPYWPNVVLLMHMDGANGSTAFTDSSISGKSFTRRGAPTITTDKSQFGGASALFSGSGQSLETANGVSDFAFGTGDFTIEFWAWKSSNKANGFICSTSVDGSANGGWWLDLQDNFEMYGPSSGLIVRAPDVNAADSAWHHWAASRMGSTIRAFKDGALLASVTSTLNLISSNFCIGGTPYNSGFDVDFSGYIDELRITKGVARYTTDFTPPTAAFPDN